MRPTAPRRYVGLGSHARLPALPEMRQAAWNTLLYIVGLLPLSALLPLAVAPVVAGVVWRWLMNEDFGLVNRLIGGGRSAWTTTVFHLMWRYGFRTMSAGGSAAAGMMAFAVFGAIALVLHLLMRGRPVHEG